MNRTVERTMEILEFIAKDKEGVTLQNISDNFSIPKSSAFVIVQTLLNENYITQNRHNTKKYCLGIETFILGMQYTNDLNLTKQCAIYLNPLAEKYGKTAFVGVLIGSKIVYIHKYVSSNAMLASCALGSRKDAHITALGKAILANLDTNSLNSILDKIKFESVTENTIVNKEKLLNELQSTKERGYSIDLKENDNMISCCGAPIFDYTKKVVAAISLSDLYKEEDNQTDVATELKQAALKISSSLGYTENK